MFKLLCVGVLMGLLSSFPTVSVAQQPENVLLGSSPSASNEKQLTSQALYEGFVLENRHLLHKTLEVSQKLADKAEEPDTDEAKQLAAFLEPSNELGRWVRTENAITRFPRRSHVEIYVRARPWSRHYAPRFLRSMYYSPFLIESESTSTGMLLCDDPRFLRAALQDEDPGI